MLQLLRLLRYSNDSKLSIMRSQFVLEPYKGKNTRYTCPHCNKRNKFTRYINLETGEHVNELVGKCDREIKCGYHYSPKDFFNDNRLINLVLAKKRKLSYVREDAKRRHPSLIPSEKFKSSLKHYEKNNFVKY